MKLVNKISMMSLKLLAICAFAMTLFSVNDLCFWIMYQEEVPESIREKVGKL